MKNFVLFLVLASSVISRSSVEEPQSSWEIWQWENFYDLSGDIFADADDDGISDFVEFGFDLNPLEKQLGEEYSAELSIAQNANKEIELSLWQPNLEDEALGGEGFYGRKWFSIAVQSSEDFENWSTIADKIGVDKIWGRENVEVLAEQQPSGRYKIRIIDRRDNVNKATRFYRMIFYLTS